MEKLESLKAIIERDGVAVLAITNALPCPHCELEGNVHGHEFTVQTAMESYVYSVGLTDIGLPEVCIYISPEDLLAQSADELRTRLEAAAEFINAIYAANGKLPLHVYAEYVLPNRNDLCWKLIHIVNKTSQPLALDNPDSKSVSDFIKQMKENMSAATSYYGKDNFEIAWLQLTKIEPDLTVLNQTSRSNTVH